MSKTPNYDRLYKEATKEEALRWHIAQFFTRDEAVHEVMRGVRNWANALYEVETRLADALNELARIKEMKEDKDV